MPSSSLLPGDEGGQYTLYCCFYLHFHHYPQGPGMEVVLLCSPAWTAHSLSSGNTFCANSSNTIPSTWREAGEQQPATFNHSAAPLRTTQHAGRNKACLPIQTRTLLPRHSGCTPPSHTLAPPTMPHQASHQHTTLPSFHFLPPCTLLSLSRTCPQKNISERKQKKTGRQGKPRRIKDRPGHQEKSEEGEGKRKGNIKHLRARHLHSPATLHLHLMKRLGRTRRKRRKAEAGRGISIRRAQNP